MIPVSTLYDEYIDRPKLTEQKYLPDRKTRSADAICSYGTIREVIDFFCFLCHFSNTILCHFFKKLSILSVLLCHFLQLFYLMKIEIWWKLIRSWQNSEFFFRNLKLTLLSLNKMVRYLDKMVRYQDGKMLLYKVFTQLFIMRCQMMKPYRSTAWHKCKRKLVIWCNNWRHRRIVSNPRSQFWCHPVCVFFIES